MSNINLMNQRCLPLQVRNISWITRVQPRILSAWSGPLPYASVTAVSAIYKFKNQTEQLYLNASSQTSKSVPRVKYDLVRGESTMYKNAAASMGAISTGPSPRACNRNLIPPVLATRSMSISTIRLCQWLSSGKRPPLTDFR